jgi:hypothetical protein
MSLACVLIEVEVEPVQHTSTYVSIRQHTSAYGVLVEVEVEPVQHTSAYVSIRQHTSAYSVLVEVEVEPVLEFLLEA